MCSPPGPDAEQRGKLSVWTEPKDQLSEGTPVHLLALQGFVLEGVWANIEWIVFGFLSSCCWELSGVPAECFYKIQCLQFQLNVFPIGPKVGLFVGPTLP